MEKEEVIKETQDHIWAVRDLLFIVINLLSDRALKHDDSKLQEQELPGFIEFTPKLRGMTYGSDEYKECLEKMKPFLDHHYENNRHHPEHHKKGINDMNLIDVFEMLCDWLAATNRHDDGDIMESIKINQERFGYSDELADIFRNTAKVLEDY